MTEPQPIDRLCIDTIRTLSMDAVQAADSGHPGTPMAMAPVVHCLWQHFLRFDPDDPIWPNRDRFVLSIDHASMLLYSMLHLTGTKPVNPKYERLDTPSVTLEDIKRFRQLESKCPGHPEYRWTSGVETTTGPLGRLARESLLDHVPVRPERVHPTPTSLGEPSQAAVEYERTLRSQFDSDWPRFDIVLLGMGEDGHTASLFPGSPALDETRRWVVATTAPVEPRGRLTLTLLALTHATAIFVMVAGSSKADALRGALGDRPDPRCPASLIRTARAPVVWWADAEAAAHVTPRSPL